MDRIYLDYAATTPLHPSARRAMAPFLGRVFGNPSSLYSEGREAQDALERARARTARLVGAEPDEIVFTSGGSESNNQAIKGAAFRRGVNGGRIVVSAVEHHAVHEPARFLAGHGFELVSVPVNGHGLVDPDDVRRALTGNTVLVSVMMANNEIGTIQPVAEIGALCRERGIPCHTDAVQAVGHLPVSLRELPVDLLSASAHKFCGPRGAGFLYTRRGTRLAPLVHGGSQEKNRRAGTENLAGIAGLARALAISAAEMDSEAARLAGLRDRLAGGLLSAVPDCRLNGHPTLRLPNNLNISFDFVEGESILLNLDFEGIAVSTGSACTSSSLEPSGVLLALGLSHEQAHGSIRMSLGRWTTEAEVDRVLEVFPRVISRLRAMSPLYPGGK